MQGNIHTIRWIIDRHIVIQSTFAIAKEHGTESHFCSSTRSRVSFAAVNSNAEWLSFSTYGGIQYTIGDFSNSSGLQQDQTIFVTAINTSFTGVINDQAANI
ncbi:hypothetical protein HmCmsJML279_01787 [Escherichia coli]|nr:hypothetical protein HmCmsJML279_01787 [Escherichia coli]